MGKPKALEQSRKKAASINAQLCVLCHFRTTSACETAEKSWMESVLKKMACLTDSEVS